MLGVMSVTAAHFSLSLERSFAAYCAAVTAATVVFFLFFGLPLGPVAQMLFLFGLVWLVAFLVAATPFCVAIVLARRFSILNWWYFLSGGFATAALVCLFHAWVALDGPPLGPVPDPIPTLMQSYIRFAPSYWGGRRRSRSCLLAFLAS